MRGVRSVADHLGAGRLGKPRRQLAPATADLEDPRGRRRHHRGDQRLAGVQRCVLAGVRRRATAKPGLICVLLRDERGIVEPRQPFSAMKTV